MHIRLDHGAVIATSHLAGYTQAVQVVPLVLANDADLTDLTFSDDKWHKLIVHRRINMVRF